MQPASVFYHSTVKFPNKNVLVIGGSGFGKTRFWLRLNLMQLPMRPLEQSGEWGAKSKKEYILNKDGQRIKRKDGSFKDRKIDTVDWNDKGKAEIWQQAWADVTNKYLAEQNIPQRVDHRSYKRQGIEQIPTEHMGVAATQMERKGIVTEKGEKNRLIREENRLLKEIKRRIAGLEKWVKEKAAEKNSQSINPFRSYPSPTAAHAP